MKEKRNRFTVLNNIWDFFMIVDSYEAQLGNLKSLTAVDLSIESPDVLYWTQGMHLKSCLQTTKDSFSRPESLSKRHN